MLGHGKPRQTDRQTRQTDRQTTDTHLTQCTGKAVHMPSLIDNSLSLIRLAVWRLSCVAAAHGDVQTVLVIAKTV